MKKTISTIFLLIAIPFARLGAQNIVRDSLEYGAGIYNSPDYLLRGKISGVRVGGTDGNPASAITTDIRGLNSIFSGGKVLWIVDGTVLSDFSAQQRDAFSSDVYGKYNYMQPLSQLDFLNLYDIENIEVVKNVSETSSYGSRGANGVIRISTKKAAGQDKVNVRLNSNVGFPLSNVLGGTVSHNHNLSASYSVNNILLCLSAFYRDIQAGVPGASDRTGGVRLKVDSRTNKFIWVGLNSAVSVGRQSVASAAANYGVPSMGLALRGISPFESINTIEGWAADHDDYSRVFRANSDVFLRVNFLPSLYWKTDLSFDCNNATRYMWYGLRTAFGNEYQRASAIALSTSLGWTGRTQLNFERFFGHKHFLKANAEAEVYGDILKTNVMSGDHYFTDVLREKGYSLRESASSPNHINKSYYTLKVGATLSYDFAGITGVKASFTADKRALYDDGFSLYPSGEVYFDIHKLALESNQVVSGLRLSAGYGKAGSREYFPYQLLNNRFPAAVLAESLEKLGIVIDSSDPHTTLANYFDGYRRADAGEYNASADVSFLKDRIRIHLGAYNKTINESLTVYGFGKQRFTTGYEWEKTNRYQLAASSEKFHNRGIEIDVNARLIEKGIFRWDMNANMTYNQNDIAFKIFPVKPVPECYGGLGMLFSIGDFKIDMLLDGAAGFTIYNANRMVQDGAIDIDSKYVERGDYLRLSRLSMSYDLAMKWVNWMKTLRFSANAANIFTASAYSGYNPDVNCFGHISAGMAGVDYGSLPVRPVFMFGISAIF